MNAFLLISLALISTFFSFSFSQESDLQTYIVFVDEPAEGLTISTESNDDLLSWYNSFLPTTTLSSNNQEERMVHSYRKVATGFAAKLTPREAKAMEGKEGFISARVERSVPLHTTHSPNFLGLQQNLAGSDWNSSNLGEGLIIGLIDSGIKQNHASFSDEGMPPPPAKWRGKCEFNGKRTCNNKLIGARSFPASLGDLPSEDEYHGSHTAGTAAGSSVRGANVLGQANGTAMGIAPKAHLAMYKVCGTSDCPESGVLAAIDAAIEDGVDGESLYQPEGFDSRQLPIIDPAATGGNASAVFCVAGSLKNIDVKGKIVVCQAGRVDPTAKGREVKDNGGAGMIFMNDLAGGDTIFPNAHVLPASQLSYRDGLIVMSYLNSTQSPTASISFQGTLIGKKSAPQVASFSSRGPSLNSPGILKPDIIGPGVNILAAWPVSVDNATNSFNMISGTSMSCPHLSGVATLVKSAHPNWSPAAIKSAILTTAYKYDRGDRSISTEQNVSASMFDMGSGHVNLSMALSPGLVYDIQPDDYIPYLCGLGYGDTEIRLIVQRKVNCSNVSSIPEAQLNYPTFSISLGSDDQKTFTRTVTNVGLPNSTYTCKEVLSPEGVDVKVMPYKIEFKDLNEKASYSVTFTKLGNVTRTKVSEGHLIWSSADEKSKVVSAIVVDFV
ncbi:unnamed protein product [Linum tenue]|uniref:Uncharacterized protein n=1 Tax=Linum tenue TaxID=586396 RepID=A0AAV0JVT2_9ROSI|nr:unnamed protein product [Linum tenue]